MQGLIYKPMNPRPNLTPDEALKIINLSAFNQNNPEPHESVLFRLNEDKLIKLIFLLHLKIKMFLII